MCRGGVQTYYSHAQNHPESQQAFVDHSNVCPTRASKPRNDAHSMSQRLDYPCSQS